MDRDFRNRPGVVNEKYAICQPRFYNARWMAMASWPRSIFVVESGENKSEFGPLVAIRRARL